MNRCVTLAAAALPPGASTTNTVPAPYIHSSASVFPTEIYEEIITIISEDPVDGRANLCCCALVSRLWLFWSHRCLYRVLDFTGEAADEFKQIENLIRALRDIPHLCLRIQVFRFGVASQPSRRTYDASRAALMHLWPIMVAGRLPNLRELGFAEGGFQDTCNLNASFFASLTTFRTVTTLRLTMMGFSYVRFMRLLSSLPSLGTLAMHKLEWNDLDRSFPSEFVGPRRPDIRMLRILDRSGLLFGYDCPYKASYARRLWQIMGSFRETMEVLSLDSITLYGLHDLSAALLGDFPAIRFPRLCTLTLGYDFMASGYARYTTTAGLYDFINRLDMPCLHTINLVLHITPGYLQHFYEVLESDSVPVSYDDGSDVIIDPTPEFQTYAAAFPYLRALNVLYLVYPPLNSTAPEELQKLATVDSTVASASGDAEAHLICRYLALTEPWRTRTSTASLYQRGILTIRATELNWQHESTPPRLAVTQWKYHILTERPTVSSLYQLEYDEDIVDVLLTL
ncbi:hypothetical protein OH76DRAFT_1407822 [Lentinus brumalis]|uniref:F-box domain-containing protein n=1 Tax=Lentinus brumalis TaxID=2498619 RepID=A0A371CZE6_9APHY|nr:hypothetical protein OH76DRAFT_1407822 [Polyporus brumalis]